MSVTKDNSPIRFMSGRGYNHLPVKRTSLFKSLLIILEGRTHQEQFVVHAPEAEMTPHFYFQESVATYGTDENHSGDRV